MALEKSNSVNINKIEELFNNSNNGVISIWNDLYKILPSNRFKGPIIGQ